ncbi:hypothetical protein N7495_007191 [Penicillium taxi]|uniref:uncharacterized protein n=1 Tax=Penicillium taxi TaxID=168475 RepID=UPI002545901C|nr:uncharacterized protein N7495_007191 [Penicillium taxi]KAJ5895500.1 hypothetical protein N7495_007191 [Penicillium taxi]
MLLHTILRPFVLVMTLVSLTLAASFDHTQTFTDLRSLRSRIDSINDCLETFDGGILKSVSCGKALYDLLGASASMRSQYESSGAISSDQLPEFFENYHAMQSSARKALKSAASKSSQFDSAGFTVFAQSIIESFSSQRAALEKLTTERVPTVNHSMIAGPSDSLDAEFRSALHGMSGGV